MFTSTFCSVQARPLCVGHLSWRHWIQLLDLAPQRGHQPLHHHDLCLHRLLLQSFLVLELMSSPCQCCLYHRLCSKWLHYQPSYISPIALGNVQWAWCSQHADVINMKIEPPPHHDLILPSGCLGHDASLDLPHGSPPHRGSKSGQTSQKILTSLNVDHLIFVPLHWRVDLWFPLASWSFL